VTARVFFSSFLPVFIFLFHSPSFEKIALLLAYLQNLMQHKFTVVQLFIFHFLFLILQYKELSKMTHSRSQSDSVEAIKFANNWLKLEPKRRFLEKSYILL